MDGLMGGWVDGWINGWMDGATISTEQYVQTLKKLKQQI
jgi:hypothetical protein